MAAITNSNNNTTAPTTGTAASAATASASAAAKELLSGVELREDCAIKRYNVDDADIFFREVFFLKHLRGPGKNGEASIVEILDISVEQNNDKIEFLSFAMPSGKDLIEFWDDRQAAFSGSRAAIYEQKLLNHQFAEQIAFQLLCALEHIHSRGVIHNDLHPSNILIYFDDARGGMDAANAVQIRLCDFGNSIIDCDIGPYPFESMISFYHAPEEYLAAPSSPKKDIYSFGAICFYLLHVIRYYDFCGRSGNKEWFRLCRECVSDFRYLLPIMNSAVALRDVLWAAVEKLYAAKSREALGAEIKLCNNLVKFNKSQYENFVSKHRAKVDRVYIWMLKRAIATVGNGVGAGFYSRHENAYGWLLMLIISCITPEETRAGISQLKSRFAARKSHTATSPSNSNFFNAVLNDLAPAKNDLDGDAPDELSRYAFSKKSIAKIAAVIAPNNPDDVGVLFATCLTRLDMGREKFSHDNITDMIGLIEQLDAVREMRRF